MSFSTLVILVITVPLIYALKILLTSKRPPGPKPPGPPPKPIVGNIADLPSPGSQDWVHWAKHKERYGMTWKAGWSVQSLTGIVLFRAHQLCYCHGANHCASQ